MRKVLALIGLLAIGPEIRAEDLSFAALTMPENPSAFNNCTARVKVTAARLRSGPSLEASVLGLRYHDEAMYVVRVEGKWVQVVTQDSDTAYMAAYLLSFPYHEMLEQWKKENPSPSVGKKAKVKWASVNYRKYPSLSAPRLGAFIRGDEVAILADLGDGWSLVESRSEDGKPGCYGFLANRALGPPDMPDFPHQIAALAKVRRAPGASLEPTRESPSEYLARTAWSPAVFVAEYNARQRMPGSGGQLIASVY